MEILDLKTCRRCVLPESFPGIRFNEEGICNFCLAFKGGGDQLKQKAEYRKKFEALVEEYRGSAAYDALTCFSGGKDSTHTLIVLKEQYKLNVLAVSVDNGFVSPRTYDNIRAVVDKLGVDHIYFKPRFDTLSRIFRHCAANDVFPRKATERASNICTACMAFVKYSTLRLALEKDIPLVAYGWSPGQAFGDPSMVTRVSGKSISRQTTSAMSVTRVTESAPKLNTTHGSSSVRVTCLKTYTMPSIHSSTRK